MLGATGYQGHRIGRERERARSLTQKVFTYPVSLLQALEDEAEKTRACLSQRLSSRH